MEVVTQPSAGLNARHEATEPFTHEISAQRPRSPATGESADEVRAEPDARRRVQRVVGWLLFNARSL